MIRVHDAVERLTAALGGSAAAKLAASALVEADALGLPRFGIAMLDEWTAQASAVPEAVAPQAVSWLDCSASFAPLAVASACGVLAASLRSCAIWPMPALSAWRGPRARLSWPRMAARGR
jgi:hypothetical protein